MLKAIQSLLLLVTDGGEEALVGPVAESHTGLTTIDSGVGESLVGLQLGVAWPCCCLCSLTCGVLPGLGAGNYTGLTVSVIVDSGGGEGSLGRLNNLGEVSQGLLALMGERYLRRPADDGSEGWGRCFGNLKPLLNGGACKGGC